MAADSRRIKELFGAAIELPDALARAEYLDRECGDDVELRQRLDALLKAHDAPASALEQPLAGEHTGDYASATIEKLAPGSVFAGRYKLREQLGEGGMGVVYVADQLEPVQRRVALKLIRANLPTDKLLARFEQERQALALMDHPNIAKVYDAGVADNTPYFVMELIKGLPITKYCDDAKLTPKQRLELFIPVCQAVQHAHQKGIIHRDLKPANIIVGLYDGRPVPKVIDFGVAKMTGPRVTEHSVYTEVGSIIGTLEYMSPEQAELNNLDIDTRTDIYALGVILYELLTGTVPFSRKEMQSAGFAEMLRIIKEIEPSKPSTKLSGSGSLPSVAACRHTEPAKLTRLIRGELDWITMKALEKDRARRYETANGMALDIQRYLDDEPVQASPPSTTYRLWKFARKNRAALTTAAAIALLLVAGVAVSTWQAIRATHAEGVALQAQQAERDRAEGERLAKLDAQEKEKLAVEQRTRAEKARDRTRDVLDAMTSSVTGDSLSTQKAISAEQKKFLESVLGYYREFASENPDDERSRARNAEAANRVGLIESRLGRMEEAAAAFRIARDRFASLAVDFSAVPAYRSALARSHNCLGIVHAGLGESAAAEEQYRKGLAVAEKLAADFPAVPDYGRRLAVTHNGLGALLAGLGQGPAAEEQHREALAIWEKLVADFPAVPENLHGLAQSHNNLGTLLAGLGQGAGAEDQYRKGLEIFEKLAADFPVVPNYRHDLAKTHNGLGGQLGILGQGAASVEQYRKAMANFEKLAADFPAVPDYRSGLAKTHNGLGGQLGILGQRAASEEQHRMAMAIFEKLAADFPAVPNYRSDLAYSQNILGTLLAGLGQGAAAAVQFRKALAIREKLASDFPAVTAYQVELGGSYCNLGLLIRDGGDPTESLKWFGRAIACLQAVHEKEPRDITAKQFLRNSHADRALAHDRLEKFAEAVTDWERAIALSPPAEQRGCRAARATSRLNAGMVAEAVAEVAELTKSSNWNTGQWYDFVCVYSLASGKIAGKKAEYTDRAMELLQKAVKAGYKNAAHMKKDTDLDPLRDREDFKKLIAELEEKAKK
jgi:eukaryotic-like serine/threonine-protein kinase